MKIIIHGGFLAESNTDFSTRIKKQDALIDIVNKGYHFLKDHIAIDAAAYTVSLLENNSLFNAGTGSQLQSDAIIRMTAALMDGSELKLAGVINIEKVRNPILVAQKLLKYDDRILSGSGATTFARTQGFEIFDPETAERRKEYTLLTKKSPTSTVGCVCIDAQGTIATATSTGGKGFETPGRVSDSATVAGTYANKFCGVSLTGVGEDIVSTAMASQIVTRVTDGMNIKDAFKKTFIELQQIKGYAGAIGIDRLGTIYHQQSISQMVYASYDGKVLDYFK